MKQLLLVRHAKSSWSNPHLKDFDRPLNDRGLRDAPVMASYLKQLGIVPDSIISSAANRAMSTAQIMAEVLLGDSDQIVTETALYATSAEGLLSEIRMIDNQVECLMLVAHNPSISELLDLLVAELGQDMPTCGVAVIELDVADWRRVLPGTGILIQFVGPKQLGHS
ncbi:MAG: histidine phosphatase family protein [Gammaproteobacteria bacterium]|nr:histidine phosphatase family protein [Gammaproteobacteria bacterium]